MKRLARAPSAARPPALEAAQRNSAELEGVQVPERGWTPLGRRKDPLTVPARKEGSEPVAPEPALIVQEQRALEELAQVQARALRGQERR